MNRVRGRGVEVVTEWNDTMSDLPPRGNPGPKSRKTFLTVVLIVLALIVVIFIGLNINHTKTEGDRPMGEDRPSPTARQR